MNGSTTVSSPGVKSAGCEKSTHNDSAMNAWKSRQQIGHLESLGEETAAIYSLDVDLPMAF